MTNVLTDLPALLLGLIGFYMIGRVIVAFNTGKLWYKGRYQPERVVHFREDPREFLVISAIFLVIGTLVLWAAWSLISM